MKPTRPVLFLLALAILLSLLSMPAPVHAQGSDPVVRAVLFYSPTCPHCAQVIQQDLPPLFDQYGAQLEIIGVDISQPNGQALYMEAIDTFQIPQERLGVPTLVVDDVVLVGSVEIPTQFPPLVAQYLAQGGVDWPAIPSLTEAIAAAEAAVTPTAPADPAPQDPTPGAVSSPQGTSVTQAAPAPGLVLPDPHDLTWQEKFTRDLAGNTLSVIVLVGMLGALVWAGRAFFGVAPSVSLAQARTGQARGLSLLVPLLCVVGSGVAGYLAYVESAQVTAVCGPVGDCNTVQQSEYARLFGVLPIGALGLAGYVLILLAWLAMRSGRRPLADWAALSLLGMTLGGALFSVYLTFLEPFVIGATCAWCLTSAAVMTALLLFAVEPGRRALAALRAG
ncbi:MAG: vitamin K epoxide reductase family protein [Chloroflexota bacterium]